MIDNVQKIMNEIRYGFKDKFGNIYNEDEMTVENIKNYILQSPTELIASKYGTCFDQVELERYLLGVPTRTFYIYSNHNEARTHTFITFQDQDKWIWYEHAWKEKSGIYKYNSLEELLGDVMKKFIEWSSKNGQKLINSQNVWLFEYTKPEYGLGIKEFTTHASTSDNIPIEIEEE